jgi:hypothetical protein
VKPHALEQAVSLCPISNIFLARLCILGDQGSKDLERGGEKIQDTAEKAKK